MPLLKINNLEDQHPSSSGSRVKLDSRRASTRRSIQDPASRSLLKRLYNTKESTAVGILVLGKPDLASGLIQPFTRRLCRRLFVFAASNAGIHFAGIEDPGRFQKGRRLIKLQHLAWSQI
jgi:hypothetical protein